MASRKARSREALSRRIETLEDVSRGTNSKVTIISKLASGEGVTDTNDETIDTQYDANQSNASLLSSSKGKKQNNEFTLKDPSKKYRNNVSRPNKKSYAAPDPDLIPHFAGFEFQNQEDAEWLGLNIDKSKRKQSDMVFGKPVYGVDQKGYGKFQNNKKNDVIFFNSNQYLGSSSYNTMMSSKSGRNEEESGKRILDFASSALQQNADKIIEGAEERLLRVLVTFRSARNAMKAAVYANIQPHDSESNERPKLIEWSSFDREWLFNKLIDSGSAEDEGKALPKDIQDGNNISELRQYLSTLADVPIYAFGVKNDAVQNQNTKHDVSQHVEELTDDIDSYNYIPSDSEGIDEYASSYNPSEVSNDEIASSMELNSTSYNISVDADPVVMETGKEQKMQEEIQIGSGVLDTFFIEQSDAFEKSERLAELTVQETVAVILRASSLKRKRQLSKQWLEATEILSEKTLQCENVTQVGSNETLSATNNDVSISKGNQQNMESVTFYKSMGTEELKLFCEELGKELTDVAKAAVELDTSARRMGKRLLHFSAFELSKDSTASKAKQALEKEMDAHMANLPINARQPNSPGDDGEYIFGSDSSNEQFNPMLGGKTETGTRTIDDASLISNNTESNENELQISSGIFHADDILLPPIDEDVRQYAHDRDLQIDNSNDTFDDKFISVIEEKEAGDVQTLDRVEYYSAEVGSPFESIFDVCYIVQSTTK